MNVLVEASLRSGWALREMTMTLLRTRHLTYVLVALSVGALITAAARSNAARQSFSSSGKAESITQCTPAYNEV